MIEKHQSSDRNIATTKLDYLQFTGGNTNFPICAVARANQLPYTKVAVNQA